LEKYAVRCGGGANHRFGLYDGVLIKDTHIRAVEGIKEAVRRAKEKAYHLLKIEVETETLQQVEDALGAGAEVIMLDNMDIPTMRQAVERIGERALVEASGNISLENVTEVASCGVDLISVGELTHSAPFADVSLKIRDVLS
jgi:nicotinate-nucleotide pyrophosphorylase (carboxylating)